VTRGCIVQAGLGLALVAAVLAAPRGVPAQEVDPFSLDLERSAQLALARDDAAGAARKLRLACFGMLDLPPRLAACLVRLGVAESRAGEREAFLDTFERLDGVEQRFHVYAQAPLEYAEREEFETRVGEWIAPELLAGRPAFAVVAARRAFGEAEGLLGRGEAEAALARLEGVAAEIDEGRAWCLRGEAYAALDRCEPAASAFAACRPETSPRSAAAALGCLTGLGRVDEASRLAGSLPAPVREDRAVQKRLAELRRAGGSRGD